MVVETQGSIGDRFSHSRQFSFLSPTRPFVVYAWLLLAADTWAVQEAAAKSSRTVGHCVKLTLHQFFQGYIHLEITM
jgi:hypothetical protein